MNPSRRHRWIAWLLPLFILRAIVPLGFMWAPASDGPQIVLCSGVGGNTAAQLAMLSAPDGASDAHAHHHEHAQPHAAGHGQHEQQDHESSHHQSPLCPFAAAGLSFVAGLSQVLPVLDASAGAPIASYETFRLDQGSIDLFRIRGPPSLIA